MVMRSLRAVTFLTSIGILAGCATAPTGEPRVKSCTAASCEVEVTVSCHTFGMFCRANVDFYKVEAHGNNVFWTLRNGAGQSYEFDPDSGIEFKTAAGKSNFGCQPAGQGRFRCDNRKASGEFEYSVKVKGWPFVPRLDPWVVN
jgi:hypothetical protein